MKNTTNNTNHSIEVTAVRMKIAEGRGMKAICNITINDMISINDIRIIENATKDLFIAMPSKKMPDSKFKDVANPTNPTARKIIEDAVFAKYKEMTTLDDTFLSMIS